MVSRGFLQKDNDLAYEIDTAKFDMGELSVMSPELEATKRSVTISKINKTQSTIQVNLEGIKVYAVIA